MSDLQDLMVRDLGEFERDVDLDERRRERRKALIEQKVKSGDFPSEAAATEAADLEIRAESPLPLRQPSPEEGDIISVVRAGLQSLRRQRRTIDVPAVEEAREELGLEVPERELVDPGVNVEGLTPAQSAAIRFNEAVISGAEKLPLGSVGTRSIPLVLTGQSSLQNLQDIADSWAQIQGYTPQERPEDYVSERVTAVEDIGLREESNEVRGLRVLGLLANQIQEGVWAAKLPRGFTVFIPRNVQEAELQELSDAVDGVFAATVPTQETLEGGVLRAPAEILQGKANALVDLAAAAGTTIAAGPPAVTQQIGRVLQNPRANNPLEFQPVEASLLGTTPQERGLYINTKGRSWLAATMLRGFEKNTKNYSLGEDVAASFAATFGDTPGARRMGFLTGFLGDVVMPQELVVLGPLRKGASVLAKTRNLKQLVPSLSTGEAAAVALRGRELEVAPEAGKAIVQNLRAGGTISDIPATIRSTMAAMADDLGTSLDEMVDAALGILPGQRRAPGLEPRNLQPLAQPVEQMEAAAERVAQRVVQQRGRELGLPAPPEGPPGLIDLAVQWRKAMLDVASGKTEAAGALKFRDMEQYHSIRNWIANTRGLEGFRPKAMGAHLMRWIEPTQEVTDAAYTLATKAGDEVGLTLERALQALSTRADPFARVLRRDYREVARISRDKRRLGQIVADRDFALPDEVSIIDRVAKELKPVTAGFGPFTFEDVQTVEKFLADLYRVSVHGVQARNMGNMSAAEADLASLVADATKVHLRSKVASDRLVSMTGNLWLTKTEADKVGVRLKTLLGRINVGPDQLAKAVRADGVLDLDDGQRAAIEQVSRLFDVPIPAEKSFLFDDWLQLQEGLARRLAGRSANAKWAMRGAASTADSMLQALVDLTGAAPGAPVAKTGSLMERARDVSARFVKAFIDPMDVNAPGPTKNVIRAALGDLKKNGFDLVRDTRRVARQKGVSAAEALAELVGDFHVVPASELRAWRLVDELKARVSDVDEILALRTRVLQEFPDIPSDLQGLRTNEPDRILRDLLVLRDRRMADAEGQGRMLLLAFAKREKNARDILDQAQLTTDQIVNVWDDFLEEGINSDLLKSTVQGLYGPRGVASDELGLADLVLQMRAQQRMSQALDQLQMADLAAPASGRVRAALDWLAFNNPIQRADGMLISPFDEGTLAQAQAFLKRHGLETINAPKMEKIDDVVVPPHLKAELDRAKRAGLIDKDNIDKIGPKLYRAFHQQITAGFLLPRVRYFLTNGLGMMPIMHLTRGSEASKDVAVAMRNNNMVTELAKRLSGWGKTSPSPTVGGSVFVNDFGQVTSIDALERVARNHALDQTAARFETAQGVIDELRRIDFREHGTWQQLTESISDWNEFLVDASSAPETWVRMGTYLNEVKKGRSLDEAAETAASVLYKYADFTQVEKQYIRRYVMFWSFIRRNADALVRASVNAPERVLQQSRFFLQQRKAWGADDDELIDLDARELSALYFRADIPVMRPNGEVHPRYKALEATTGAIGAPEAIFFLRDVLFPARLAVSAGLAATEEATGEEGVAEIGTTVEEARESALNLIGMSRPLVQLAVPLLYKIDAGTGWRTDTYGANEIPLLFRQPGLRSIAEAAFGMQERQVQPGRDPERNAYLDPNSGPMVLVAEGDRGQATWQLFRRSLPQLTQIAQLDRALALPGSNTQPRPWLGGRLVDLAEVLTGLNIRGVERDPLQAEREDEASRLRRLEREARPAR